MINCIIIEDEPLAMERLRGFVQKLPYLQLTAAFDNGMDALVHLKTHGADLIFLDIKMDEMSGISFLENAGFEGDVIMTTAYDSYALKGYDLNVTDFLLKPYSFERFVQAVEKVRNKTRRTAGERDFIFVKTENRLEKINLADILYIEGMRDYRCIYLKQKRIMTLMTFKELEEEIAPEIICRVHKSFMVALAKIDAVERDRIRIGEVYIPVSETYRQPFYSLIQPGR